MTDAFITIAGIRLPYPDKESGLQTQAVLVSESRNALGVFIGQKIGRMQSKVELSWKRLHPQVWAEILQAIDRNFVNSCEYYDMKAGRVISRKLYAGNATARPGKIDPKTGVWLIAKDCKLNFIDTGG